jgi:hypothetical protein
MPTTIDDTYIVITAQKKGDFYNGVVKCYNKSNNKFIWKSVIPIQRLNEFSAIQDAWQCLRDLENDGLLLFSDIRQKQLK